MTLEQPMPKIEYADGNARAQVGALVWRFRKGILQILLVNSRDTGRYVIPKGWAEEKLEDPAAAAKEAYEEAGVLGHISRVPCGSFAYAKTLGAGFARDCLVTVYAMECETLLEKWPEMDERKRYWMPLTDAAASVEERDLKELMENFVPIL